jgi:hypothetical protein
MSRKCRGGSSVNPIVRYVSGSIECSTMVVRNFWKNGRISGGRRSIARSAMNLWPPNPQASSGTGRRADNASANRAIGRTLRMRST